MPLKKDEKTQFSKYRTLKIEHMKPHEKFGSVTSIGSIPGGNLIPGIQIVVQGVAPAHSEGFSINLSSKISDSRRDIALHFNPRKEAPFEIVIVTDLYCYNISVNKRDFCRFKHRHPLTGVNTYWVEGIVKITSIKFLEIQTPSCGVHPAVTNRHVAQPARPILNPPGCSAHPAVMTHHVTQPTKPIFNPAVPLTTGIPGGLYHGKMIFISGVPAGTNRFTFYLQEGSLHNADVGMVFDVRFNFGSCVEAVIRNHRSRGTWGQEEHTIPYFPFVRNVPFEIIILSESTGFKVAVNNQHFLEFRHRLMPLARFNMLHITGDVTVKEVRFQ
ncbi:LGALS9 [Mytilus edulis]|uniref:Galectin n=1 Tax=Mytilus edulis TaxID=6550 RepID=A0A8S3T3M1_MYTED|nr:LGALS9 [Mytilus edulis]